MSEYEQQLMIINRLELSVSRLTQMNQRQVEKIRANNETIATLTARIKELEEANMNLWQIVEAKKDAE